MSVPRPEGAVHLVAADDSLAEGYRYRGYLALCGQLLGRRTADKRRRRKVYGKTKAEVRDGLKTLRTEIETGVTSSARYTVADAVRKWLDVGLKGRDPHTVDKCTTLAKKHIVPAIGAAKLRDLTADDLGEWLGSKKGLRNDRKPLVTWVGDTGIEPVTSSV